MRAPHDISHRSPAIPAFQHLNRNLLPGRHPLYPFFMCDAVRCSAGSVTKKAIDSGVIPGPRVYPSGALISQTSGHGDYAPLWKRPKALGGRPAREEELGFYNPGKDLYGPSNARIRGRPGRVYHRRRLRMTGGLSG